MCRLEGYEYYNRQCKWVRWCRESKSYVPRTGDDGLVCPEYTTEVKVVEKTKEDSVVAQATIEPEPEQVKPETTEELAIVEKPKVKIFVDESEIIVEEQEMMEKETETINKKIAEEKIVTASLRKENDGSSKVMDAAEEETEILKILKSKHPKDSANAESYLSKYGKK